MRKLLIITLLVLSVLSASAVTQKNDETRFQLGAGIEISSGNLLGLIETVKMISASSKNEEYSFPGMSDEQVENYNNLSSNFKKAIWISNLLSSMEYGIHLRILKSFFIAHADITLLPFDGTYNGRLDFMINVNAGIRAPWFIMPYLTVGGNFTMSVYPDVVSKVETWKTRAGYGVVDKFAFRPGMNITAGVDIKTKAGSIGAFYKYTIKDFNEFNYWYDELKDNFGTSAAAMIFGAQSRFGVVFMWYIF